MRAIFAVGAEVGVRVHVRPAAQVRAGWAEVGAVRPQVRSSSWDILLVCTQICSIAREVAAVCLQVGLVARDVALVRGDVSISTAGGLPARRTLIVHGGGLRRGGALSRGG